MIVYDVHLFKLKWFNNQLGVVSNKVTSNISDVLFDDKFVTNNTTYFEVILNYS